VGNAGIWIGSIIVALVLLAALLAPWVAPYGPNDIALEARLLPPSAGHLAGTDELGRDLFSRIVWGTRASLGAGIAIVLGAGTLGLLVGCLSGYLGGRVDRIVMRLVEILMALPSLVMAMALTAALGASLMNAALALAILAVPYYVRVCRGQTLAVRQMNFVRAAQVMGAGARHQLTAHIVPNVLPHVIALATWHFGSAILSISTLSFIGLGAQPPLAEWGALVNMGRRFVLEQWWYALFPGMAIVLTVFGFNCLGDGLRDALDPKAANRSLLG
jgi:peptide/nickel transport system permease protein